MANQDAPGSYPAVEQLIDDYLRPGILPGAIISIGRGASAPPDYVSRGTIAFDSDRPAAIGPGLQPSALNPRHSDAERPQ